MLARVRTPRGLDYGATIEFEADTDETVNSEETWLFVRGGWGEVRLGDVDGVAEESAVGAQEVAAGTGGIDGDVVDEIAVPVVISPAPAPRPSSATIRRASPASAWASATPRPRS